MIAIHANINAICLDGDKEQKHIRGAPQTRGYPDWIFVKTSERSRGDREEEMGKRNNITIPYVARTSEKLRSIFNKHQIWLTLNLPTR